MMKNLKGKVILITGSSKGIGAQIAKDIAEQGAKVVINYASSEHDAREVLSFIDRNGGTAIMVKADISKEDDVINLYNQTLLAFGKIDVIINNAGVMNTKLLQDHTEADFDLNYAINVKGTFFSMKQAASKLADNGIIINFSSATTKSMTPGYAIYSSSKAAIEQMTRVFSKEIGRGITVNAIAPGPTSTELFLHGKSDQLLASIAAANAFKRIAHPSDISKIILFLACDDSKWISGQVIGANGAMA